MTSENSVLCEKALASLKGKWGSSILIFAVLVFPTTILEFVPQIGESISFICEGSLLYGITMVSLKIARNQNADFNDAFSGFQNFGKAFVTFLFMSIYIFLWSLLLIIPGIIAAYSYSLTFYLLIDEPELSAEAAIQKSIKIMEGNKWKLFLLHL